MYLIDTNIHAAFLLQSYEGDAQTKHYLSFVDCLILGVAEKWRYGLLTRDERMKLVARNLGIGLLETLGV